MEQFHITLKNENERIYYLLNRVVVFLHIITFLALAVFSNNKVIRWTCIISTALLIIFFILRMLIKKNEWRPGYHVFFVILMITWINMHQFWMAAIPLVFDILFLVSVRRLLVIVTKSNIIYPSIIAKKIQWDNLNNVMLKDNMLTIDFKNNKLIQQMIDDINSVINEKEFNDFCIQQLKIKAVK